METNNGIIDSLKNLTHSTLALVQARIELVSVEFSEERKRWFEAIVFATGLAIFASMTFAIVTFGVLFYFWETHRILVMSLFAGLYVTGTVICYLAILKRTNDKTFLAATADEFKKDGECIHH